ncbi:dihydrolipoamide dehydrogenase [beta proteobacterium AAP99]|nr:dihydrolipoamide dehydrogenase [beta proteobacterium AAP99]
MALQEVKVPDIGDFKDVEVIEVLVKVGDTIARDQSLITVESDKASMEIPSAAAGVVKELKIKVGDKVSQGTLVLMIEAGEAAAAPAPAIAPAAVPAAAPAPAPAPVAAASYTGGADLECDVLVLGAGPGGYSAAFRAADLGLSVVIVERYPTLGGVCLNVGCIPSKALLHVAAVIDEVQHFADIGVHFGTPKVELDKLRKHKEKVIGKLTGGLTMMAKARKVTVVRGYGSFVDVHHVKVELTEGPAQGKTGASKTVRFKNAIIAAGSQAVRLPFMPEDPRIVDSTGALELKSVPKKMLVLGGGIIGLEMGTVYSTLGTRLDVVEMLDGLMQGADRDLVKIWQKMNAHRYDNIYLKTRTVAVEAKPDGLWVKFEGEGAPKEPQRYDMILQSVGRSPNGRKIGAEQAGVAVSDRGFIAVDKQMRTNVPHIFAIGDIVGQPMLAHKAVHEGHVAAEVCAGHKAFFDAKVIPSVAYTDPEVAWVGETEDSLKAAGRKCKKGLMPWAASGRAIANGRDEGFTKLLFDEETGRIIGGGIVGTHAGDLIGEICLAIEMGADSVDIGKTIHPHPTLGESVGLAAEAADGHCTDLPPVRK